MHLFFTSNSKSMLYVYMWVYAFDEKATDYCPPLSTQNKQWNGSHLNTACWSDWQAAAGDIENDIYVDAFLHTRSIYTHAFIKTQAQCIQSSHYNYSQFSFQLTKIKKTFMHIFCLVVIKCLKCSKKRNTQPVLRDQTLSHGTAIKAEQQQTRSSSGMPAVKRSPHLDQKCLSTTCPS